LIILSLNKSDFLIDNTGVFNKFSWTKFNWTCFHRNVSNFENQIQYCICK